MLAPPPEPVMVVRLETLSHVAGSGEAAQAATLGPTVPGVAAEVDRHPPGAVE